MSKGFQQVTLHATSAFRAAFSLVELSIVLVILGLLAGGILTGQSLIRAAQLRAIPVEFQQYQTAVMSFQDKYRQLPGDMRNATEFFGQAATCPPTSAAPLTGRATCNGDGDGRVESAGVTANEQFTLWQHLSNGGMIEGSYTGASGSGVYNTYHQIPGVNTPESRVPKMSWFVDFYGTGIFTVSDTYLVEGTYNNALFLGEAISASAWPYGPFLLPEEAWNIDTKIDDGEAGKGKLVVWENYNLNCYLLADGSAAVISTTAARVDIQYKLADKSRRCSLIFRDVF